MYYQRHYFKLKLPTVYYWIERNNLIYNSQNSKRNVVVISTWFVLFICHEVLVTQALILPWSFVLKIKCGKNDFLLTSKTQVYRTINISLYFPWEMTRSYPISRKDDLSILQNYNSVYFLQAVRIFPSTTKNGLFTSQHGFFNTAVDYLFQANIIFLDFQKASDQIDQFILLSRLV